MKRTISKTKRLTAIILSFIMVFTVFAAAEPTFADDGIVDPLVFEAEEEGGFDLPAMEIGTEIDEVDTSVGVSGGVAPYKYSSEDLPDGITIDEDTGVISGTPTTVIEAGTADIVVTDSDENTATCTINYGAITVAPEPLVFEAPEENAFDLPNMEIGTAIETVDTSVGVTGGTAPYKYSSEELPDGITIDENTGVISGTPTTVTEAGTADIVVTDSNESMATCTINYGAITAAPDVAKTINLNGYTVTFRGNVYKTDRLPTTAKPATTKFTANSNNRITINWNNISGSQDIDGYCVLRKTNTGNYVELTRTTASATSYLDKSVKNNVLYYYVIIGYKNDGKGNIKVSPINTWVCGMTYKSKKKNAYNPTISKKTATITTGKALRLKLTYPKNSVSTWTRWSTSNRSVATVSSTGLVTGKSAGKATITARTPNGREIKCVVTIKDPPYKKISVSVPVKLQLTSKTTFKVSGSVTNSKVASLTVSIDDKYVTGVKTSSGKFTYTINLKSLSYGWHYVCFTPRDKASLTQKLFPQGVFINKPSTGTAMVIVPENLIKEARTANNDEKAGYAHRLGDEDVAYTATGKYEYSAPATVDGVTRKFDSNGIIMNKVDGKWYYQPTTITQYALALYDPSFEYDKSSENYATFIKYCDWLVANMGSDGAFRQDFDKTFVGSELDAGWVSGMTQGQVLSLFGRAYYLTGENKYNVAGQRTLNFMLKRNTSSNTATQNGTEDTLSYFASLDSSFSKYASYPISEEILISPQVYILNGNLYAVLGLYDWSILSGNDTSKEKAADAFEEYLKSIEVLLPYYDFYGYSSYDLRQFTKGYDTAFTSGYAHGCHVALLKKLFDVTGDEILGNYYERFKAYYDDDFYSQTGDLFKTALETTGF